MRFDTLVVGGSFSGLVTALKASEGGTVGVVDKRSIVGSPVNTTGAIPMDWLKKMNLMPPRSCIASETFGMELVGPDGTSVKFTKPKPDGYILYPEKFTQWLADEAKRKGVEIFSDTRMTSVVFGQNGGKKVLGVETSKGRFDGKYLVGADGHGSNLGKAVGLTQKLAPEDCHIGLEYVVANDNPANAKIFRLFFGAEVAPGGYAWSFPEGDDRVRVGVGIPMSVGAPSKKYLDRFRAKNEEFAGKVIRREGGAIPTAKPLRSLVKGNVLVVGDAGRFCSPLHGGGIWFGMWSGRLAGEAIVRGKPELYDPLWKEALGGLLSRHYKLKRWFYGMSDSDLNRLFAILKTYQTSLSDPDREFSSALFHVIRKDPLFVMKSAAGWAGSGLLTDAVHRVVSPKFRIA